MKVIAFAASNSRTSINKLLVTHAADLLPDARVDVLDLNDYALPLFSVDVEAELGQPQPARAFLDKIAGSDALIISFAEHNGSYTAAYKNLFDWCTRIEKKLFQDKPMVLLSASPGGRGASSVLAAAVASAPFFGGEVKASLSVPDFFDNFDTDAGVLADEALQTKLQAAVASLKA
jgi:chromate reductase, NAD(P)H dehydrogenase (quinone)